MATHSLSFTPTGHLNQDCASGTRWSNSGVTTTAVTKDSNYDYALTSITLNVSSAKYYVNGAYFKVYNQNGALIGNTPAFNSSTGVSPAITVNPSGKQNPTNNTFTLTSTNLDNALAMTTFYIENFHSSSGGNLCNLRSGMTLTLTITYTATPKYTRCTNPTNFSVTYSRGTFTIAWSGASAGTLNPITGYKIIRNTSQSETNATTVASKATSSPQTNTPAAGSYYYGIKTLGTASGYDAASFKWSSQVTSYEKPTVSAGDKITKDAMDSLKQWIGSSPTSVTKDNVITETVADTYNAATQYDQIKASWYNT